MSIIIRLQNLPWAANAMDIRQYFNGLAIPEGGVHIVGGELGDAFIAFSTDEDARQAFQRNNGKIKGIQIQLMLSSRTEMQRVIEQARNQSMSAFMLPANAQLNAPVTAAPVPAAVPAMPAAVPDIKKDDKDLERKKDRRRTRSRSKSRDKKDRSRDRKDKRRDRDRTRSRSREKRDRRRRDQSRSRNRSRDRESRRRENRVKISPKRDEREDNGLFSRDTRKQVPEVWTNHSSATQPTLNIIPPARATNDGLLGAYPLELELTKRGLVENLNLQTQMVRPQGLNGFQGNNGPQFGLQPHPNQGGRLRESWPPTREIPPNDFDMPPKHFNGRGGSRDFNSDPPRRNFRNLHDDYEPNNDKPNKKGRFNHTDEGDSPMNACISMEPFYGSYGDLRRFFQGLNINYKGIKIINDEFGHKTGICYVQFRDASIKDEALLMNGCKLDNTEVKIEHISDQEFYEGIDRFKPSRVDDNFPARSRNIVKYFNSAEIKDFTCLKVEDLPSFVKEQDILHIFSQHPLISLHLSIKPKGGTVAYVKFSNKEVAKLALDEKSNHVVAGKTVTVKPCKDEEFENFCKEQNAPLETDQPATLSTDCLRIDNLPSKTTDRDISDFFSDIGVIPTKIHLMSNNLGFTGEAYCEFETSEEATKAVAKNRTALGQNTITVSPIPRPEMNNVLNNTLPHPGQPLPSSVPLASIKPAKSENAAESKINSSSGNSMKNPLSKPVIIDLEEPVLHIEPPEHIMSPSLHGFFPNNRGFGARGGGRGGRFPHRGGGGPRFNAHINEAPADDVTRGCTVFMDNVPYKAGTNEILDFFDGYNSTNNVSRRYNPNNTPSAEAKVTFYNPDDAFRAVSELNGKKIWGRSIYLTQS